MLKIEMLRHTYDGIAVTFPLRRESPVQTMISTATSRLGLWLQKAT